MAAGQEPLTGAPDAVKVTENYLNLDGDTNIDPDPAAADSDTKFIESKYYAYHIEDTYQSNTNTIAKLVLERFEGTRTSLIRTSVENRSTVPHW